MTKSKKKLSKKREIFTKEYLVDLDQTKAAKRAGYSKKTASSIAHNLMMEPEVKEEIQNNMDKRADDLKISADYVLRIINDTIERCQQAKPVLDKFGKPVMVETKEGSMAPAYMFDAGSVLRGAELLGKHIKLFTDKIEHSGNLNRLTDEEIDKKMAELLDKNKK